MTDLPEIWREAVLPEWCDYNNHLNMAYYILIFDHATETRVYLAVGDSEERLGLVTDLHVLVNELRGRRDENLKLHLDVLPGELHEGIFPTGFMKGIVAVYAEEPERRASATRVTW